MKIEKINKKTEKGVFEILFRDGNWGVNEDQVTPILKALVKQHNNMVDVVNKLLIHNVSGCIDIDELSKMPNCKEDCECKPCVLLRSIYKNNR